MVMNSCEHETERAQPLIYNLDIIVRVKLDYYMLCRCTPW